MNRTSKIVRGLRAPGWLSLALLALLAAQPARADQPNARSRDYDLQHVSTHLWLDANQKSVRGEVSQSIAMLRDGVTEIRIDSTGLKIQSVSLDGKAATFSTPAN